jgi:acetoin utilization deacetylase AcuC-like enzyme
MDDLRQFKPDLIAVSAGFDAYRGDPLCQQQLEAEDYHWFGDTLRQLGTPLFSLLEGGYSDDLPELILAYLRGLEGLKMQDDLKSTDNDPRAEENDSNAGLEPFWGSSF